MCHPICVQNETALLIVPIKKYNVKTQASGGVIGWAGREVEVARLNPICCLVPSGLTAASVSCSAAAITKLFFCPLLSELLAASGPRCADWLCTPCWQVNAPDICMAPVQPACPFLGKCVWHAGGWLRL